MSPRSTRWLGVLGFLGVGAMIVTDVLGIFAHPHYDPLADTISLLAYHQLTGPQDVGLFLLALGTLACGVGLFLWLPRAAARVPLFALLLLASGAMVTLTVFDVRARHFPEALDVHIAATLLVGAILLISSIVFPFAVPRSRRGLRLYSFVCAGVLALLAAVSAFVPQNLLGLYERVLVADGLAWLGMVSYALLTPNRA